MRELKCTDIIRISGAGMSEAELIFGIGATWLFRSPYAGAIGAYIGGKVYSAMKQGYQQAPGVNKGLGSFNPNYNPRLLNNGWNYYRNRECNFDPFNDNDNCY
jgi:hypothetical protein